MTPYGEVDGLATLLGYKTANAGCCKVTSPCPRVSTTSAVLKVVPKCKGCGLFYAVKGSELRGSIGMWAYALVLWMHVNVFRTV